MKEEKKDNLNDQNDLVLSGNPLVFISHDTRDAKFAEAFSALLKSVSAGVLKSFRTSDRKGNQGIEYGVEWYPEIIKNIQDASDVVCLLTSNSINRPWILFEAGMAKGKLETPILGVALGISLKDASSGPFAQFQNCGDDEESLTKLVFQLVGRIPNSEPDEETIKFQVEKFKKTISGIIKEEANNNQQDKKEPKKKTQDNSSAKLFEEIKVMFQDLPSRIERNISSSSQYNSKKRKRFDPILINELMHISGNKYIGFIISLSLFKESMPWLYEIGMETVRTIRTSKNKSARQKALFDFQEILDVSVHHPATRALRTGSKDDYMLFKELPRILSKNIEILIHDEEMT